MKNPYCDSLEYDEHKHEHKVNSIVKTKKQYTYRKGAQETLFTDRINQLIVEGKVKVYYSMKEFYARKSN
jgi:hypothetical protein